MNNVNEVAVVEPVYETLTGRDWNSTLNVATGRALGEELPWKRLNPLTDYSPASLIKLNNPNWSDLTDK